MNKPEVLEEIQKIKPSGKLQIEVLKNIDHDFSGTEGTITSTPRRKKYLFRLKMVRRETQKCLDSTIK